LRISPHHSWEDENGAPGGAVDMNKKERREKRLLPLIVMTYFLSSLYK
jgi:hypothetical protein